MNPDVIEDFIYVLSSINKIIMIAFLVTLFFLIYEIYLLQKERARIEKPKIPKFEEKNYLFPVNNVKVIVKKNEERNQKQNIKPLLIAFFLMVFFGVLTLISMLNPNKIEKKIGEKAELENSSNKINVISSNGILIFSENWIELKEPEQFKNIKIGDKIYIGLETIKNHDIDKARLRVNENNWKQEHIISQFNADKNIYYKEYVIPTDESKLKIEAQLHSVSEGWLGD